jgi:hypothetical protein
MYRGLDFASLQRSTNTITSLSSLLFLLRTCPVRNAILYGRPHEREQAIARQNDSFATSASFGGGDLLKT